MTESMVERVARAIFEAMDIADGLDGTVAEKYALAAIAATPLADAAKAFEQISNFSDSEMGDGDGARRVADEWLERWKPEVDEALK